MNIERYHRQIIVPQMGMDGQQKLKDAKVLVIGAGGLGSPVLMYLAGAGIGTIGILDADNVSISNLPRQIIHPQDNIGMNKAESAKARIQSINEEVQVITYPFFLTEENGCNIVKAYDFVVDCVDNFRTKFLINDICVLQKKPFCHAGVWRMEGQVMTYVPGMGPCYRCIFEEIPDKNSVPDASRMGIINAMAGMIGSIQALEVIKYFTQMGELLTGKIFKLDGETMNSRIVRITKSSPECRSCCPNASITDEKRLKEEYEGK